MADERQRTSVVVEAPRSCATTEQFEERIRDRSTHIEFVARASAQRRVRASLRPLEDARVRAALEIQGGETSYERSIVASDCDEALEALAFMTALFLDPEGVRSPPEGPLQEEPLAPAAPSSAAPFVGAGLLAQGGVAPAPLWGPEIAGGLEWQGTGLWLPRLRLALSRSLETTARAEGGTAHFALTSAHIELCPVAAALGDFSARPCIWGGLGRLDARGADTLDAQTRVRPWWALGGALVLAWQPAASFRLTTALRVGGTGVRDSFQFEPYVFHEVPAWTAGGSLNAEVPFP